MFSQFFLKSTLKQIKILLLDVDGVLTDGSIWMGNQGEIAKPFYVRDGFAIVYAQKKGIEVGIITGRSSECLKRRAEDLHITCLYQGVKDKFEILEKILKEKNLTLQQVAYMGDDIPDICILNKVGLPAAPRDAASEVKHIAKYISSKNGGRGAVRDLLEKILKAQKLWIS
jgi:3-deoxy-D-manno-octulosonate 8-phosphate phosphatase (KDO 8-P phosphatase)